MELPKNNLYKILWGCLMAAVSICDAIRRSVGAFFFICSLLWHRLRHRWWIYKEFRYIAQCKEELTKIPCHLSIVVGSERLHPSILSRIAIYALLAGVEYITYYDVKGELSLEDIKLPDFISSHKLHSGRFVWFVPGNKQNSSYLRYKNGMEKSIEVLNLSQNNGIPLVAEVCRDLHRKKETPEVQEEVKDKDYLSACIGETLRKKLNNLPEVDLAIVFDRNSCTYGLLPWQTAFTEFYFVNKKDSLIHEAFVDILYKFSKCQQRFGK